MLRKVIDEFDIDTHGWFDDTTNESDPRIFNTLTKPASDIWSLWVKQPTEFRFSEPHSSGAQSVLSKALACREVFHELRTTYSRNPAATRDESQVIRDILRFTSYQYGVYNADCYLRFLTDFDDLLKNNHKDGRPTVNLPNHLVNPAMIKVVGDTYLLSDAITGIGLELLESASLILPPLQHAGVETLYQLNLDSQKTTPHPSHLNLFSRTREAVVADCTLDIWWALQVRSVREPILLQWPGWAEIFVAQDAVTMPAADSMQSLVTKKSPHRSELRRFCMALAWNINPHNTRVKFPPHTKQAYEYAISQWPSIMATTTTGGEQLSAIHRLVAHLSTLLNTDEDLASKSITLSGSNQDTLHNKPTKNRSLARTTQKNERLHVEQQLSPESVGGGSPPTAVIYDPPNWSYLSNPNAFDNHARTVLDYALMSRNFQDKHRKAIADQISASAWFVPNPPPLEHGNLDGVLDEGNLLRYAAFSDPTIFSVRPESGAGQIAIGVLVDSSGSMGQPIQNNPVTRMQAALCFVGGLRDGLSRNPNVKLHAFAFDSRNTGTTAQTHYRPQEQFELTTNPPPSNVREDACVCALRRLDSDDDLLHTMPWGGTPTSPALLTLDAHLAELHPEAQRIILILTDGAPCGIAHHPYTDTSKPHSDSPDEVRKTVSAISTPIFCVGIDVGEPVLKTQYNVGHWFSVASPMDAVKVACDLVRGIGQSLNC